MRSKFLFIALALTLTACSEDSGDAFIKIIPKVQDKGYKKYIAVCAKQSSNENTCRCEADMLKKELPDKKIMLLANAGEAMQKNDKKVLGDIAAKNPEVVTALRKVLMRVDACNTEHSPKLD